MPQLDIPTVIADPEQLSSAFAIRIASVVGSGTDPWSFAIPGGSVATKLLPHLAQQPLRWSGAHVFFVDERWVPEDSPDSNWRLCRAVALGTPLDQARWHRIDTTLSDPASAARAYLQQVISVVGERMEIDVALLGIGDDGHVASIFPGSELETERAKTIAFVTGATKPPARRLSMSLPLLASARLTAIAAFGSSKRQVVQSVRETISRLPAARLLQQARHPLLLLDREIFSM